MDVEPALRVDETGASSEATRAESRASERGDSRRRRSRSFISIGALVWVGATALWLVGGASAVTWAEGIGWLVASLVAACGVALFAGTPPHASGQGRTLVDGLIVAGSALNVAWVLGLADLYSGGGAVNRGLVLAGALSFVVIASATLVMLTRARSAARPRFALAAGGLFGVAVAQGALAYVALGGSASAARLLYLGWAIGWPLVIRAPRGSGVWEEEEEGEPGLPTQASVFVPSVPFALAVLAAALAGARGEFEGFLTWSSAVLVVLIVMRQVLALVENISFWRRLQADVEVRTEALRRSEARFRSLVQNSSDVIAVIGPDGSLLYQSASVQAVFGYRPDEIGPAPPMDLIHDEDVPRVLTLARNLRARAGGTASIECRIRHRDGRWRDVEAVVSDLRQDPPVGAFVVNARDVTEHKALEDQLRHQAFHDPLTQLANRSLFSDRLTHALERHTRVGNRLAVLFIDLDDFKRVNDRLGHDAGDEVMVAVARRIQGSLRAADTGARLGGDEFAVLLEGAGDRESAAVAERILAAFRAPLPAASGEVSVSLSIGIAVSRATTSTSSELLRNADLAMYMAKMVGRSRYEFFTEGVEEALLMEHRPPMPPEREPANVVWLERADAERTRVRALIEDPMAVRPVFQPIVEIASGRVAGFEALARFDAVPDRPPNTVFAQAHRYGLGSFLEAKAIAAEMAVAGRPPGTFLTLNVSPAALNSREVQRALPESLRDVIIEITESDLMADSPAVQEAVAFVRGRGARLAVDDVGAGYAGLRHLMNLAPELIKLDQTLVQNARGDVRKAALVESLVNFARRIDADVCGEGVESVLDLSSLEELEVRYGQGNLLGPPIRSWSAAPSSGVLSAAASRPLDPTGDAFAEDGDGRDRVSELLATASSWEEVDEALALITVTLDADRAYLSRVIQGGRYLALVSGHGDPDYDVPYAISDYPSTAQVLADQAPREILTTDNSADPREVEFLIVEGMKAGLMYPVLRRGRSVGLLEVFCSSERHWERGELAYLGSVCERLGDVLERIEAPRLKARN